MANTYVIYTGNGSTTEFVINYEYLDSSHVYVSIDGTKIPDLVGGINYTYSVSGSTVTISPAPANQTTVKIYRFTPRTPLVNYTTGAVITENDLDIAARQGVFVAAEAIDNGDLGLAIDPVTDQYDAGGRRIEDLGAPVSSTDAATKGYVDTADAKKLGLDNSLTYWHGQSKRLKLLTDPSEPQDAATKQYVDDNLSTVAIYATANPVPVTLTGDGSTKTFQVSNVTHTYAYALLVVIDGIVQQHGNNYSLASGSPYTDITFSTAPPDGSNIAITNFGLRRSVPEISDTNVIATDTTTQINLADRFAQVVSVKDFGATGDGTTDDSTAIKLALASSFENIYFPEGTYIVDSWGTTPVTLSSSKRLIGNGNATISFDNDALFKPTSGTFVLEGLNFTASNNGAVIYDTTTTGQLDLLRIRKCRFSNDIQYAIWTRVKYDKAEVIDCEFDGVEGSAILLGYGGSGSDNYYKSTVIRGNIFKDMSDSLTAGRIILIYGKDVLIEGNRVENYTYTHATGNIELFYTKSLGAKFVNNTIDGITAVTTGTCAAIVLKGVARGGTLSASTDQYGYQNVVKGNIIRNITSGGTVTGIDNHCEEIIIDSNIVEIDLTATGGSNCYSVDVNTTSEILISNNRFYGGNKGVDGQNVLGNIVVANNIVEDMDSVGIDVRPSDSTKTGTVIGNQITYNSATAATPQGILISGANGKTVVACGNSISFGSAVTTGGFGINVDDGIVTANYVNTPSGVVGIRVSAITNCNVTNNTVTQTITQIGTLADILDNNIHGNIVGGTMDRPPGILAMAQFVGDNPTTSLSQDINVASVTRTAAGEYDVLFTTPTPSTDYLVMATCEGSNKDFATVYDRTTAGFTILRTNHAGTNNDRAGQYIMFTVHGVE